MPSTIREAFGRRMTLVWQASSRRKTGTRRIKSRHRLNVSRSQPEVDRSLSDVDADQPAAWEIGATVLFTSLPVAVFIVAGEQAVATAGPSAMCSVMLVTAACGLTAYCQAQLPSRHQRYLYSSVAGSYELLYRMCGEAIGYFVGWLLVLQHCSFAALVARTAGLYTDSFLSAMVSNGSGTTAATAAVLKGIMNASATDSSLAMTTAATSVIDGEVNVNKTGNSSQPDVVTAVISLLVIAAAVTSMAVKESGHFRDVISRLFRLRGSSPRSMTQSLATGSAVTVSALVLGLVIFAGAVSLSHGLHFSNWQGNENFFAGGISGLLTSTAFFYFLFNTYDDVTRRVKSVRPVLETENGSRPGSPSSGSSLSISAILAAIVAMSSICVIALTTLTAPAFATSPSSSNSTLKVQPSVTFSGSYSVANLVWMKRIVCVVAVTSLVPVALLKIQDTAVIINKIMSDGLLPTSSAEPEHSGRAIFVTISGGAIAATLALVCSPTILVGLVSVVSLAVNSLTSGTVLDAIYRPLETASQRRSRPRPCNRKSTNNSQSSSRVNSALRSTDASSSSVLYGTNLSPVEDRFIFDDASVSLESDVITECPGPKVSTGNDDSESIGSRSSDTDIDDAVDDFQQTRLTALAHCRQDDALIDVRCPDVASYRRAIRSLVVFIASIIVVSVVLAHARSWLSFPSVKSAASVCSLVLGIVTALTSAAYACFLPRNDDVLSMTSRDQVGAKSTMRVRWAALASIGINWSLTTLVEPMSYVVIVTWLFIGIIIYLTYGMQHSNEKDVRCRYATEEQRILLPADDNTTDEMSTRPIAKPSCSAVVSSQHDDHSRTPLRV